MSTSLITALLATPTPPALRFTSRPECRPVAELESALAPVLADFDPRRSDLISAVVMCWHDHYDASHDRCQIYEGDRDAEYMHALLHRREGDARNAGYWFARVGEHPVFPVVAAALTAHGRTDCLSSGRLDALALVRATVAEPHAPALIAVQDIELHALVEHLLAQLDP